MCMLSERVHAQWVKCSIFKSYSHIYVDGQIWFIGTVATMFSFCWWIDSPCFKCFTIGLCSKIFRKNLSCLLMSSRNSICRLRGDPLQAWQSKRNCRGKHDDFFWQSSALDREQHDIQDFVLSSHVVSFKYTLGNHKHTHLTLLHKLTL